jgi:alanine racemase
MHLKHLDLEALTSHLSSADERAGNFTEIQIKHFMKAIEAGRSMGLALPFNSLANSAGVMWHQQTHFEMVRPGIMLYGGLPSPDFISPVTLKTAMHFKGQVLQVRDLPDHTPISYGRTYYTEGPRRIAILSAGYGDGLPRSMSNRGNVLVRGKRVPIVGTICMNLSLCDITGLEDVKPGDEAVFLGSQGDEIITGDDIARWSGTVSYEVFCSIGHRNKKEYLS